MIGTDRRYYVILRPNATSIPDCMNPAPAGRYHLGKLMTDSDAHQARAAAVGTEATVPTRLNRMTTDAINTRGAHASTQAMRRRSSNAEQVGRTDYRTRQAFCRGRIDVGGGGHLGELGAAHLGSGRC